MSSRAIPNVDLKKWNTIYPNYLNSNKTIQEGRQIGKEHAVQDPNVQEMGEACKLLQIPFKIEINKSYPRDWMVRGRLRFLLANPEKADAVFLAEDGEDGKQYFNDNIRSKKQFLRKLADIIKTQLDHRVRNNGLPDYVRGKEEMQGQINTQIAVQREQMLAQQSMMASSSSSMPMGMPNMDQEMPHIPVVRDPFGYKLPEELATDATNAVNEGKEIGEEDEKGADGNAGGGGGGSNAGGGKKNKNKRKKK